MTKTYKLLNGDCLDKLKELEDNSIDSIVTDPPYGLAFMGKKWDYDVPSQQIWEECIRVLKPGGHLLSFAGSRTYHRMAVRIEDAGFEIRDQIMWVYGSGFPKSHNIGKSVDKIEGNEREVVGEKKRGDVQTAKKNGSGYLADPANRNNVKQFGYGTEIITKGNSTWEGWGTALKPAHEPIVMARKPLSEKTVADNVLEWGTGGINIDESRIPYQNENDRSGWHKTGADGSKGFQGHETFKIRAISAEEIQERTADGRFPANIILDEEAGKILDKQSGNKTGQRGVVKGTEPSHNKKNSIYGDYSMVDGKYAEPMDVLGGASRFFYCPKASKKDRNEALEHLPISRPDTRTETGMGSFVDKGVQPQQNNHPTVKPTELMTYLVRLVTPKGGIVLDPFMGSGSTGKACIREGFQFVGIEREKEYMEIAQQRIEWEYNKRKFF
jgi:DNA modification methylase